MCPAFVSGTGTDKFLRGVIEKSNRKEWFRAKLTVLIKENNTMITQREISYIREFGY